MSNNKGKKVSKKEPISINKAIDIIVEQIQDNIDLIHLGEQPTALNFEGIPGIGKTSIFKFIEKNYTFQVYDKEGNKVDVKNKFEVVQLSDFVDSADVVGLPLRSVVWNLQFPKETMIKLICHKENFDYNDKDLRKIVDEIIDNLDETIILPSDLRPPYEYLYTTKGVQRTMYAVPNWIPNEALSRENNDKILFIPVLDDFTRCEAPVRNTIMPVILERKTISYELPKYSMVFMTSNPDDGLNNVIDIDQAQGTRYLTYKVKFSQAAWEKWILDNEIFATTLFRFLKDNGELLNYTAKSNDDSTLNPRVWHKINNHCYSDFKRLESIEDVNSKEYKSVKNKILSKFSEVINTAVSAQFGRFLTQNAVYIPPMEDLMDKWTDKQVAQWFAENVKGSSKQYMNVSLSLVVSHKIGTYLSKLYKDKKEFPQKQFNRFVRMYWDVNTEPYTTSDGVKVRHLNYLHATHAIFLASRIRDLLNVRYDNHGDEIRIGCNRHYKLELCTVDENVSKVLTDTSFDELFSDMYL